ncbi:type I-E CRISPR-associated protein Cas6/Cse3/CasE [Citrobacter sp. RHB25-C09]|uniref:type I-E CRISPR-associated protein Cas6/Cse3/CasE n=1 Tax=Citrobacter sp. RHB25-C09 TaxID=2742624 RepID=UPI0015EFCF1E|nr:type I-E CRISPR-associated protein Cas6/Cse3/CasE [Citrobacter sp. RHB25-C09]QMI06374.1 type I-E CRISPR-associated protein Cas6/Cse3/CasE [Citrobacter sp. RHB25-C09]
MYLSRITLHTAQLSPAHLLDMVERGEYVMHQWLWALFPDEQERQFLYRREELQGAFRFFVLSANPPVASELFTIECRAFSPTLHAGQLLRFNLRANPTICKAGKRHDLLMDAKFQIKDQPDRPDIWLHQQNVAKKWLSRQGETNGFSAQQVNVEAYRQQQVVRGKSRQVIQYSSVDYSGVLEILDPKAFLQRLMQGYGKSRAFGCGLMLIKPGVEA